MAPPGDLPEGVVSVLDTDLYKLTMQSAVLKYFPKCDVTYSFINRTPEMKLSRAAYLWLSRQVEKLSHLSLTGEERAYLKKACPYLSEQYLDFLEGFRFRPREQVETHFSYDENTGSDDDLGSLEMHVSGLWVDTILYEIPLLALTSEAFFKFRDRDWNHEGQMEKAREKGLELLRAGCMTSEFGSRRRRDYTTHDMVVRGLVEAQQQGSANGYPGKITGTSNVHLAMKHGIPPIGTVAHEWFMGVAAVTDSYNNATQTALDYWIGTFGKGVLSIALTDTFGTPTFLKAFAKPITPMVDAANPSGAKSSSRPERYADVFVGTRQDSGDPKEFVKVMRRFYDEQGIQGEKTIVFSDSLNVERCIELRQAAAHAGFVASFGVGTFFTNDYARLSDGKKSVPLNIVIKLASAAGKPAIKISDNLGKNTGDSAKVAEVKEQLGYVEKAWSGGDESKRWNP